MCDLNETMDDSKHCRLRAHGSYKSCKTWKVMKFMISISRPGNSWNSSEGHGMSRKSKMLSKTKKAKG